MATLDRWQVWGMRGPGVWWRGMVVFVWVSRVPIAVVGPVLGGRASTFGIARI